MNIPMIMLMLLLNLFLLSIYMLYNNTFLMIKLKLLELLSSSISIDFMLDWMSLMFMSTVMLISSMIIIFSKYYIPDKEFKQFLTLLLMFVLSMMILIMSNNLFLMLLGWDGLGLSSYILVIYYQNFSSAASGTITLLSNRIGDIMILLSMSMIFLSLNWSFNLTKEFPYTVMLLLMVAACTKSAQFPFSAWLPMAMAAPTPISALVHSSTLVTAGVFLMLRVMNTNHPYTLMFLLLISSSTAIYASMSANWEQDLKKIIALSTLSQIAMMMFAISLNSLNLAYIHLIIHALFKSTMFLCTGIMIHESTYQDMRMMGMNFQKSPLTLSIMGVNSMALMGIPFMSGFFSKDAIIENMILTNSNMILLIMMIMSIGMTAAYTIRMTFSSNKSNMKCFPLMSNHQSTKSFLPISLLSPLAITSGSWLSWIIIPDQILLINHHNKMTILIILLSGLLLGSSLQFKSKKYMKLGLSSISLWFMHFLSVIPSHYLSPLMKMFHNNDKNWQENYGPKKINNSIYMSSMIPESTKSSYLMIISMSILIPLLMM
uniref:NADH-ubiquinone oxidoreductase chain 5 n=1 Tax=Carrhotus xanthogramma TaxID=1112393 RepID=A0A0H3W0X6_CARXA|nr:NADH dehydrogenase subunit 5 [Carrhotus xanthogramma]AKH36472.1 NADH dehydrogenase subunit 5 [Carrhotus xanthogramma]